MPTRRATRIVTNYILSLAITFALLVTWIVYFVRSGSKIRELGARAGVSADSFPWVLLSVGCALLFLLIVGLTYQLAQALAARRYSLKQEEFMSNITHEMKSPLAAIKLHAQTLQHQEVDAAARGRSLGYIVQQADRMGVLVDNVLESSRLLARKTQLDLQPVALGNFFEAYLAEARARAEGQGVALHATVSTEASALATTDALHRVMDNLVDNAVRFSERGGEVRLRVEDADGAVRIEVEDDGVGIPKQELEVFDRFYQAAARAGEARRGGTGLGLSIVAGLVEEMGGTVRAHSQEGRPGTRFVIELPRAAGGVGGSMSGEATSSDPSGPPHVLVVEDEEAIAAGLVLNLELKGYAVDLAREGEAALQRAAAGGLDLIVLDVRLPGVIDGFEVCQRLRGGGDFTPILMLTARSQPDDVIFGLKMGADDYVVKPFDLAELLARVEGLLRRRAWSRRDSAEPGRGDAGRPVGRGAAAEGGSRVAFGEYWVDFDTYQAQTRRGVVQLSQKELAVMKLFLSRPHQVVARRELLAEVWQLPAHPNTRVVDNVIVALRQAFEEDSSQPRHILSVRGVGYRFVP